MKILLYEDERLCAYQAPVEVAERAEPADTQGSIFRYQSPK